MPYKKTGSIPTISNSPSDGGVRFKYHAVVAVILMVVGITVRFVVPAALGMNSDSMTDISYLGLWIMAKAVWVWACCHLALHFRLSAAWGLWGMLFLIGVVVIVWAKIQKPKWDLERARQPKKPSRYKGDPDSLY